MVYGNRRKKNGFPVITVAVTALLFISVMAFIRPEIKERIVSSVAEIIGSQGKYTKPVEMKGAQKKDDSASNGSVIKKMPALPELLSSDVLQGVNKENKDRIPDVDFAALEEDSVTRQKMILRKEALGIRKGLDMVVRSDETFKLGETTLSMRDLIEKIQLKKGGVFEESLNEKDRIKQDDIIEYGIYVVQSGDNIWNIHFKIIKEFFSYRGHHVLENADEPLDGGLSSGVGKLLKFSEKMVFIYNLPEKRIDDNINLLEPLSKIVIYNMKEVFSLLHEIDLDNVDKIRFDGQAIWIPAKNTQLINDITRDQEDGL